MLDMMLIVAPLMMPLAPTQSDTLEFVSLAAGDEHTCGIAMTGKAFCWGSNQYGQIGDGRRTGPQSPYRYPTLVVGDHEFESLALGLRFTCGLTDEGRALCWGHNFYGQIGDGTTSGEKFAPTPVKTNLTFVSIVAGHRHVCALTGDGGAYCWGDGRAGQLGDGRAWDRNRLATEPTRVVGGHVFAQLGMGLLGQRQNATAGDGLPGMCGFDQADDVYCWGRGVFAYGDYHEVPTLVSESKITGITGGPCTLFNERAWCVVENPSPLVADSVWTPTAVIDGLTLFQMTGGTHHGCGLTAAGKAYCWGQTRFGQLGTGERAFREKGMQLFPGEVFGDHVFTQIEAGGGHTCALDVMGRAYCWGDNSQSQIGQDRTAHRSLNVPTLIVGALPSE